MFLGAVGYWVLVRPWHQRWGASEVEAQDEMPGDDLVPNPLLQTTRAVTIAAPPEAIWPWLVQMGYGRAGWYSYDRLEQLMGVGEFAEGGSARRIIPELQDLKPDDLLPAGPDLGWFRVERVDKPRHLVLRATMNPLNAKAYEPGSAPRGAYLDGTWSFKLLPLGGEQTRLIARLRANYRPHVWLSPFVMLVLEPAHFLMERKMLLGIRERVEAGVMEPEG